jgi:hypothetical protein
VLLAFSECGQRLSIWLIERSMSTMSIPALTYFMTDNSKCLFECDAVG